jgi:hypothetical protein
MMARPSDWSERIGAILKERQELCERLLAALNDLDQLTLLHIITSWMSVEELRDLVEFQEKRKF